MHRNRWHFVKDELDVFFVGCQDVSPSKAQEEDSYGKRIPPNSSFVPIISRRDCERAGYNSGSNLDRGYAHLDWRWSRGRR
jgi:hypothetical protein